MAATGRKPKPYNLRVIEGNREHRPLPECPQPKIAHLKAPVWMSKEAKKEWKRIIKELYANNLFTKMDKAALEGYCVCYARWKEAEKKVDVPIFKTEKGYIGMHPLVSIALKYSAQMRAYLAEFGMTPSSRTRISVDKKGREKNDDLDW